MIRESRELRAIDIALLVIRIALGVIFIAHGAQKMFGWFDGPGIEGAVRTAERVGFQPPILWGYMLAISEFFGGLGILVGLLTRFAAAGILIGQLVAIFKVHAPRGFFVSEGGFEFNLTLVAIAAALLIAGAGMLSLDGLIYRYRTRKAEVVI